MNSVFILTVCLGNIHRSVVAEYAIRQAVEKIGLSEEMVVESRGLLGMPGLPAPKEKNICGYADKWLYVEPVLNRLKLDVSSHQACPLDREIVEKSSIILAMDRNILIDHQYSIVHTFSESAWKARLFMELDGVITDVADCDNVNDGDFHSQVTERIHEVVHRRIHYLVQLARMLNVRQIDLGEQP